MIFYFDDFSGYQLDLIEVCTCNQIDDIDDIIILYKKKTNNYEVITGAHSIVFNYV